ncbi:MAG TPA: ankyrin repeat domain-containing protein [Myxococcaceae bacterium]|nr:ankyrin repeat domain-containing protein [Myxococcaceae bacterium]
MPASLYEAVRRGDEGEVRRLLDAGADVNELGPDQQSPLIEAAAAGQVGMIRLLLDRGAEPAWKDAMDETALLKAAANGHRAAYDALWPLASEDERGLAKAFLSASGLSWDAPLSLPPAPPPPPEGDPSKPGRLTRGVATAASRVAKFFGDEVHAERVDRLERAESLDPKKPR